MPYSHTQRYQTYDGEGHDLGQFTLGEARAEFTSAEYDAETGTITVGERITSVHEQMIAKAGDYIVIDDGAFRYAVERAGVDASGTTEADLRKMNGDEYSAWCQNVPMEGYVSVGSQECIDLCAALEEAGSEVWRIANP
jgi:hypothetical protein